MKKVEPKDWKMEIRCERLRGRSTLCGQKWEVREEDLVVDEVFVRNGSEIGIFTVICPDCGLLTRIHDSQIPKSIQNRCIEKYKREKEEQKLKEQKRNWLKNLFGFFKT